MKMRSPMDDDRRLWEKLQLLDDFPPREGQAQEAGCAAFLQQARSITEVRVTDSSMGRHNGWIQNLFAGWTARKEHSPMFSPLTKIILVTALVLGTGGATVAAAQSSEPDQILYEVKLWSEDTRLALITDPVTDYQLSLEFTGRRAEEIAALLKDGKIPPFSLLADYQNSIEETAQYALNLPAGQVETALKLLQTRLAIHEQTMLQQKTQSVEAQAVQEQVWRMIREQARLVRQGITDPEGLRQELQIRLQSKDRLWSGRTETPTEFHSTQASGENPWMTGSPTPESGYGIGNGYGDGDDIRTPDGSGAGSSHWMTGTPTPGSGYGVENGDGSNPRAMGTPTPGNGQNTDTATDSASASKPTPAPQQKGKNH